MADLTDRAKDMALSSIFADATIGLTRDGKEIDDGGYKQQPVNLTEPEGVSRGMRAVRNSVQIVFGPWQEDAPSEITGWFVIAAGGVMAMGQFERRRRPQHGDEVFIQEREILLGFR